MPTDTKNTICYTKNGIERILSVMHRQIFAPNSTLTPPPPAAHLPLTTLSLQIRLKIVAVESTMPPYTIIVIYAYFLLYIWKCSEILIIKRIRKNRFASNNAERTDTYSCAMQTTTRNSYK